MNFLIWMFMIYISTWYFDFSQRDVNCEFQYNFLRSACNGTDSECDSMPIKPLLPQNRTNNV